MERVASDPTGSVRTSIQIEPSSKGSTVFSQGLQTDLPVNHDFIPIVRVDEREEIWRFWSDVEYDNIAVDYFSLRQNQGLYRAAKTRGIKDALGYDGSAICVLTGDDWNLDNTQVSEYVQDINDMGFEFATTPDDYVYWSDRENYRWSRIHNALDRAYEMLEHIANSKLIGIVKGSNAAEVYFSIDRLTSMGLLLLAFPCSELIQEGRYEEINKFLSYGRHRGTWRSLIGINSMRRMSKLDAEAFLGSAWCYGALAGKAYEGGIMRKIDGPLGCSHELCRKMASRNRPKEEVLSRHSLLCLKKMNVPLGRVSLYGNW